MANVDCLDLFMIVIAGCREGPFKIVTINLTQPKMQVQSS